MPIRCRWGKANAAVPHDHRRDAVPKGRSHLLVPRHLTVIVRMSIDPSWADKESSSINRSFCTSDSFSNRCDPAVGNGHITGERGLPSTIDNFPAANYDVMHAQSSFLFLKSFSRCTWLN